MNKTVLATIITTLSFGAVANDYVPTDAQLTAQRTYHHMENMVEHIEQHGINHFSQEDLADHTFFVITPALDHLYSKAMIDVTNGAVEVTIPEYDEGRYASFHLKDAQHFTVYAEMMPTTGVLT
ncbi:DUF1254 domain-containing protein [Vibrio mexicanus]|uniref:DUF1254 domain-containing protein n=1 Tax=Vibrio mexicanus TaxID=1004326 RepID=UPI00063C2CF4|nr:DUF1254 domain-containing protein [Vibrio mexicanus]